MWIYDLDTLRFLAVNNASIAKYGYSHEEFLAMTIADIRPDEDRPALTANVAAVTEGWSEAGVWRHQLKSGEIIYVDITGHTIDHDGRRAELIAARDITAVLIRRREHDPDPPDELARGVAVGDLSLQLGSVVGVQIQADVIAPHTPSKACSPNDGNPTSGGEH